MPVRGMTISRADVEDIQRLREYLQKKQDKGVSVPHRWQVCIWNLDLLMDNCADLTEDHLARSPYLSQQHVAPEQ